MLNAKHKIQLAESGISFKFALENGLRSVDRSYIKEKFGWAVQGGGLLIPYPAGETLYYPGFSRLRLDAPVNIKTEGQDGTYNSKQKSTRYLSPKGLSNHLYIPKAVWKVLNDPRVPLFFCEGEKKALKLVQEGYMAIGLPGIYGAYSKGKLIEDFDHINLVGREFYLAFDGDKFSNPHVRKAEEKLAKALLERTGK